MNRVSVILAKFNYNVLNATIIESSFGSKERAFVSMNQMPYLPSVEGNPSS